MLKLFLFSGVATRLTWWLVQIAVGPVIIVVSMVDISAGNEEPGVIFMIVYLLVLWVLLATQVRRWHDRAKSGWWVFINLIPVVGQIWAFVELGFLPGVGGDEWGVENEYRNE
jgi:uncharacterized membrane protein YhaH (DUF805 family)